MIASRHEMIDSGKHKCDICGHCEWGPVLLKRHFEVHHTKKEKFQCPECPKSFCKERALYGHQKMYHIASDSKIPCHICSMYFTRNSHQMRLWHPSVFVKCPFCEFTSRVQQKIVQHIK